MKSYIIRLDQGKYAPHARFLQEELGFNDLTLYEKKRKRIISKRITIFETILFIGFLLRNLSKYQHTHTIVSMGWESLFLKMLIKMNILKCQRFFWLGFFIHNKSLYGFMKSMLSATKIDQEYFIVNSESDRSIYFHQLGIPKSKLLCLPYADFSSAVVEKEQVKAQLGSYYFAGGFTNRDYGSLIDAFRQVDQKLIIVGSHLNKDLLVELPPNVQVLRDIPKKKFSALVRNARACILPLKNKTGASGQMVLLNYMKQAKAIIASKMKITQECVEEGKSALFYQDAVKEIPSIIRYLDEDEDKIIQMGLAANEQYNQNFGSEIVKNKLSELISADVYVPHSL